MKIREKVNLNFRVLFSAVIILTIIITFLILFAYVKDKRTDETPTTGIKIETKKTKISTSTKKEKKIKIKTKMKPKKKKKKKSLGPISWIHKSIPKATKKELNYITQKFHDIDDTVKEEEEENHQENPTHQHEPETVHQQSSLKTNMRRNEIKDAFLHCWRNYERLAWGHDELKPISGQYKDWVAGGIGMTIVDALDTLWIMDLKDEFKKGADWVHNSLDFNKNQFISAFETTIRSLGGLLSAYDLSGDRRLLQKATDLGNRLMPIFHSTTGLAHSQVNLATGQTMNTGWTGGYALIAEFGTLQLEFRRLSQLTGDPKYDQAVTKIMDWLHSRSPYDGLFPAFIQPETGAFGPDHITFGAWADSFYEYLLKQWLLTGKKETKYREMYDKAMNGVHKRLIYKSSPSGLTYISEWKNGSPYHKMDHLACFVGGMLALGAKGGSNEARDMKTAKGIGETCYQLYHRSPTGLSPEFVNFRPGTDFKAGVATYLMRPEALETLFVLYRTTKDPKYQEWAYEIFLSIQKYSRVQYGYTGLTNVNDKNSSKDDFMQSFFLAETLKYLYLIFSPDDVIPLDKYVFNTEAHPLKITK